MVERLSTGVAGLDALFSGGLVRGSTCLLRGEPGTGKTILASQIAFGHVAGGGRVTYVTLLAESISRLLRHLSAFTFYDESAVGERLVYVSGYAPLQESPAALLGMLREELLRQRTSLLVIDGIVTILSELPTDREVRKWLHDLEAATEHLHCTTLLLASAGASSPDHPANTVIDGLVELARKPIGSRVIREICVNKLRGSNYLLGRHQFEITNDGLMVYPKLESRLRSPSAAIQDVNGVKPFDVPSFDAMIGGGVVAGSSTMVLGSSGAGKTLLSLQFLAGGAACGELGLYYGFYEAPARLMGKAQAIGLPLDAHVDDGLIHVQWESPIELNLDRTAERILEHVLHHNVRRLVIDGLNAFVVGAAYPERLTPFMTALFNELRALGVTTLITAETRPLFAPHFDVPTEGVSPLIENLLILRYVEVHSQLHRLVSVLKLRQHAHDTSIREFRISSTGLEVASTFVSAEAILTGVARQTVGADLQQDLP